MMSLIFPSCLVQEVQVPEPSTEDLHKAAPFAVYEPTVYGAGPATPHAKLNTP